MLYSYNLTLLFFLELIYSGFLFQKFLDWGFKTSANPDSGFLIGKNFRRTGGFPTLWFILAFEILLNLKIFIHWHISGFCISQKLQYLQNKKTTKICYKILKHKVYFYFLRQTSESSEEVLFIIIRVKFIVQFSWIQFFKRRKIFSCRFWRRSHMSVRVEFKSRFEKTKCQEFFK